MERKTIKIDTAKSILPNLVQSCLKKHKVIIVSSKEGNVVMINEQDYRSLLESFSLLSIPDLYESILEGVNTPLNQCIKIS
mgnify:CR=1 FL=1